MNWPVGVLRLLTVTYKMIEMSLVLLHDTVFILRKAFSHWSQLLVLL